MVGFIGRALAGAVAGAGGAVASIADDQLKASIMAERDRRLQEFQAGEAEKGRAFTAEQAQLTRENTSAEAKAGRDLQRELSTQTDARIRDEGAATRGQQRELALLADERMREESRLTREQQARLAGASMAQARMLAEGNRPLQQDAQGNYFTRTLDGKVQFLLDPSSGQPMKGPKDLGAGAKIMAETIQAQIKEVEKAPPDMMTPDAKQKRMGELYRDLTTVLSGRMPEGGASSAARLATDKDTAFGWDDKTGQVVLRGQPIGKAGSLEEARALVSRSNTNAGRGPGASISGGGATEADEPKGIVGRAQAQIAAPVVSSDPVQAESQVREAQAKVDAARRELLRFGASQRRDDPDGFRAAQQALAQAEAEKKAMLRASQDVRGAIFGVGR